MANRFFSVFAPLLWSIQENENARLKGLVINDDEVPFGGSGLELSGGAAGRIQGYDRDGGVYIQINYDGLFHSFKVNSVEYATVSELGLKCVTGSLRPPVYTVATTPNVANHIDGLIVVSDASGGRALCISDGTNWRRVADNTVVS